MNNRILVTIGIPVFNEEKNLRDTLESAINQTYRNISIVVSDNCSTDSSWEIAMEYASRDSRIVLHRHEINKGVVANFKYPLSVSETKYFMWLGAHDILLPTFIEEAVGKMEQDSSIALVYPRALFFEKEGELLQSADSEIATSEIDAYKRIQLLIRKLNACTAIHGLFRTAELKKHPLNHMGCDDYLILVLTSASGKIMPTSGIQFHRRISRNEGAEQVKSRYVAFGYLDDAQYSLGLLTSFSHIKHLIRLNNVSYLNKLRLLIELKFAFPARFGAFTWRKAVRYFLTRDFQPSAIVAILIMMIVFMKYKE